MSDRPNRLFVRTCAGLCLSLACAGVVCAQVSGVSSPAPEAIDDRTYSRALEQDGGAIVEALSLKPTAELLNGNTHLREVELREELNVRLGTPELYERAKHGVLVLRHIFRCDKCPRWHTMSGGTAFIISKDGVCVTNRHMLEATNEQHPTYTVAMTYNGAVFGVDAVLAHDEPSDIAIFTLSKGRRGGEEVAFDQECGIPLPLARESSTGEQVALISHPDNSCYTLTTGIVSRRSIARKGINGDIESERPTHALSVTCEFGVGSSGGPVMDESMNVVGMVCNTHTVYSGSGDDKQPQMVRRRCIPADVILELLRELKASPKSEK